MKKLNLEDAFLNACFLYMKQLKMLENKEDFFMKLYKYSCLSYRSIQKLAYILNK